MLQYEAINLIHIVKYEHHMKEAKLTLVLLHQCANAICFKFPNSANEYSNMILIKMARFGALWFLW